MLLCAGGVQPNCWAVLVLWMLMGWQVLELPLQLFLQPVEWVVQHVLCCVLQHSGIGSCHIPSIVRLAVRSGFSGACNKKTTNRSS